MTKFWRILRECVVNGLGERWGVVRLIRLYWVFVLVALMVTEALAGEVRYVRLGEVRVKVSLAATLGERMIGLTGVDHLAEDEGLLMVFERAQRVRLWMKGTLIPLDAGFFDGEGRLSEVVGMWPDGGKRIYQSSFEATYVLEVNEGWYVRNKVAPGAQLQFVPASGGRVD